MAPWEPPIDPALATHRIEQTALWQCHSAILYSRQHCCSVFLVRRSFTVLAHTVSPSSSSEAHAFLSSSMLRSSSLKTSIFCAPIRRYRDNSVKKPTQ